MKTKIFTIGILITFFAFVSCEKEDTKITKAELELNDKTELNDEVVLKSLKSSSRKKRKLEPFQTILQTSCGEVHTFELWYYQDFAYGAVTVSNDAEFLYIQYDLNEDMIEKGWGFDATYLFIGDYNNLEYLENGININWHAGNVVTKTYEDKPVSVSRILELKNLPECFGIATKVRVSNSDGGKAYPRAFLNIENEYKYPWLEGYEYCVQNCCGDSPGTGTQGYWRNHSSAWPVDVITIGGITYSKKEAIDLMDAPGKGDKTYNMFEQLVSAKLNVMIGNCSICIDGIIANADTWMAENKIGSGVEANSDIWQEAAGYWHTMLDDYNNGKLCAPHRD